MSDPAAFISDCLALLKPKGRLVLCVPNYESFLKYQYNLLDMPPHHMTQWSVDTFRALENLYPVHLSMVKYEPLAPYHIDGYLLAHQNRLRKKSRVNRLFLNKYSIHIIRILLKSSVRNFCRGQSIYVELKKL